MMQGVVSTLLKSLGLNISNEDLKKIEVIVPQIPGKLNEAATMINAAVVNFDTRLLALEQSNQALCVLVKELLNRVPTKPYDES